MKLAPIFIGLSLLLIACDNDDHSNHGDKAIVINKSQKGTADTAKKSIKAFVENKIGAAKFRIQYHSPAVRDRVIWGGLVPYGEVWVTGAHNATTIESDKDFVIDGKRLPAGKYALFTIPAKDQWTVIVNKNWDQHLADEYKEEDDLLRIEIRPDTLDYKQERLMYDIARSSEKQGKILMHWEKLRLTIPVQIAD
jgi:hypothetical protein